jgi:tetratricopeptide (TPR) repeat protein
MDGANPHLLTIQPMFPYFLKTKLAQADGAFREALQLGFKNHYEGLAGSYQQLMESKEPQERQLGIMFCKLEYENLYAALSIAMERQESADIYFCLFKYCDLTQDIQLKHSLSQEVSNKHKFYASETCTGKIGLEIILVLERLANSHSAIQQYEESRTIYQKAIDLATRLEGVEARQIQLFQANTYNQLGLISHELREFEQARNEYQKSIQMNVELGYPYPQAFSLHNLGRVSHELREFEQARTDYQTALKMFIAFGDRYEQAGTYHQLGITSHELGEYEQARNEYQKALDISIEFSDRREQARIYGSLGNLAMELQEFETARTKYQRALSIFIEIKDRFFQAKIYLRLGSVAQYLNEYEQARNDYQKALKIHIEFNDKHSQAVSLHNLGVVSQELCEFEQARNNYRQALEIWSITDDHRNQAITRHQLGTIAEELLDFDEARHNYQLALHFFVKFADQDYLEIVIRSCSHIYQAHPSPQFLTQIAQCLNRSEAEVLQLFEAGVTA